MEEEYDYNYEIILIGEGSCLKNSSVYQLCKRWMQFRNGAEWSSCTLYLESGVIINVKIWVITTPSRWISYFYPWKVDGAIMIYDVTDWKSVGDVYYFINQLREDSGDHLKILLMGNVANMKNRTRENHVKKQIKKRVTAGFAKYNRLLFEEADWDEYREVQKVVDKFIKNIYDENCKIWSRLLNQESYSVCWILMNLDPKFQMLI